MKKKLTLIQTKTDSSVLSLSLLAANTKSSISVPYTDFNELEFLSRVNVKRMYKIESC